MKKVEAAIKLIEAKPHLLKRPGNSALAAQQYIGK
jgi:hypothetical protein